MPYVVKQLFRLLTRRQRWQAMLLLLALMVRATVDLLGVASIVPFMTVVADPGVIHRNELLNWFFVRGGFSSDLMFLQVLGGLVVIALAVSNGVSAFATWGMLRFVWRTNYHLSNRVLRGYLLQPYAFFVQRNSAALHKVVLSEVGTVVTGVLMPLLNVTAQGLVVVTMAGMLVALDPILALVVVLVLGGAYGLIYLAVRRRQATLGRERLDANLLRFKVTGEAFGGIKDVKVLQREESFLAQFGPPSWRFSQVMVSNGTIGQLPRYLLEALAFGGIVLIVLYYVRIGEGISRILPVLSLYALAGYRLMPALQTLFVGVTGIRFNRPALDDLSQDLERFEAMEGNRTLPSEALPFREAIRFEDVWFRYPEAPEPVLRGISLTIPRNQTIGLVGASGSGKTTLVDLLLGLYEAEKGCIAVDGVPLDADTIPAWRRQIGYVPQHIFLADDTILHNIAFGVPHEDVDRTRAEQAARIAHLHDFVQTLPSDYETVVGERGVRLSGGQRQRIGIARALYHDPDVLVMDEATSALDGITEDGVMEAIRELSGQKTIVLIAHRLSTMWASDCIFIVEDGQVVDQGSYDELLTNNQAFRAMAKVESVGTNS